MKSFLTAHILQIIDLYKPPTPLHLFLKTYYKDHSKLGSRDRKAISEAVYTYNRLARFYPHLELLKIIKIGIDTGIATHPYLTKQFESMESPSNAELFFPTEFPGLSEGIDQSSYFDSLTKQPYLFIRCMGHELKNEKLEQLSVTSVHHLSSLNADVYGFKNGTPIQQHLKEDEYIVQDLSSQSVLDQAAQRLPSEFSPRLIWDACSGAGGKSIMARRIWPKAELIAIDVRGSILKILKSRIKMYHLGKIQTEVVDVAHDDYEAQWESKKLPDSFDLVICDVPCSGSGTWARTPEQFYYFEPTSIEYYHQLQTKILNNAVTRLDGNGFLIYITCSVFRMENEQVVQNVSSTNKLKVVHQQLINGIDDRADCMFYAIIQR